MHDEGGARDGVSVAREWTSREVVVGCCNEDDVC